MGPVKVRATRGLWHDSIAYPPGSVLTVDEVSALRLLESGRVELLDSRDSARLREAARAELDRVLRQAGPTSATHPGSPWVPFWPR